MSSFTVKQNFAKIYRVFNLLWLSNSCWHFKFINFT